MPANLLFIAANILFDLDTGKTTNVLMLVTREEDASTFKQAEAQTFLAFVQRRNRTIEWSLAPSKAYPGQLVIRGIQNVS